MGYDFSGWNVEVSARMAIERNWDIRALYERQTAEYNTVLKESKGNEIETKPVQFDQHFTVKDKNATVFLVNEQVVVGAPASTNCRVLTSPSLHHTKKGTLLGAFSYGGERGIRTPERV